ncbi:MAG: peptide ABC transporter substrate-binding protein [Dehalococcoidia bacterium]|nr:peptide ABC transporter substrate-binding protein [Dehalococcoidia bacterium]
MPPALSTLLTNIHRRGALTALLAVGVATLAIGWLAADEAAGSSTTVYREAVLGTPTRINPLAEHATQAEADLTALIFSGLTRLRADGAPEPDLAERWEVTDDRLTYTFHLRPNVTWHDGAAFDAQDVAYTIGRIQAEDFNGPAALKAEWEGVQVFVDDALTVLIRLPEPAADFLVRATLGLLPEHLREQMEAGQGFDTRPFDREPVGTGPYRLTSLSDGSARLRHNTSYFRGTPPITELVLRFAESEAEQLDWIEAGEVDAALLPDFVEAAAIEGVTATRSSLTATRLTTDAQTILYFNNQRGPLTDARTRAALAASVDTVALVEGSATPQVPGAGVVPPDSYLHAEPGDVLSEDADAGGEPPPADAESLWAAAQWERDAEGRRIRDGEPLTLELVTNGEPARTALAEGLVRQFAEAGVTVELVTAPAQRVVNEYLRTGNYDLALFGWETPPDPDPYAAWHTSQIGLGNVAAFSDPEADALMEAARTSLDVAERRELYGLFQARFEELGASVVIAYPTMTYVHPSGLAGFEPMLLVDPASRFQDITRWRIAD